jgi:hypothetical protein
MKFMIVFRALWMNKLMAMAFMLTLAACDSGSGQDQRFGANAQQSDTTATDDSVRGQGQLLSAFFGLDNGMPPQANLGICLGAGQADGMPVIFDREVDVQSLQAGDFRVLTRSGKVGKITCVTLFPAIDAGELRTALLVGEFGSALSDPPVSVEIVGNLYSASRSVNYKSAKVSVTPLEAGPSLVLAEVLPQAQWQLGKKAGMGRGAGSGCPEPTMQIVRAVWAGGVVKANGREADDAERLLYQVLLEKSDRSLQSVVPFALADLGDGDNNHMLCLDVAGTPRQVSFAAGHLIDPKGDLNPATVVAVPRPETP